MSIDAGIVIATSLEIARIGLDLLNKRTDPARATSEIAGQMTRLIPVAELRAHLDAEDKRAIDAAANVAEELKLKETGQS